MEKSISKILEEHGTRAVFGKIDLGYENGWSSKKYDLLKKLKEFRVENSYSQTGSPSSKRTSYKIKKDEEEYELIYWTDSGD